MNDEAASALVLIPFIIFGIIYLLWFAFLIIMIIFSVASTIFWFLMLIDAIQREEKDYPSSNDKVVWVLVIALVGFIGALTYYFIVKKNSNK